MKKLVLGFLLIMALLMCQTALAANMPEINMALSETRLNGPQEVAVEISITNRSSSEALGPMALYAPDGSLISDFGTPTLAAGETRTWNGTWMVTREQLRMGRLTYTLVYYSTEKSGVQRTLKVTFYREIVNTGTEDKPFLTVTLSENELRGPQTVSVVVTVTNNTGEALPGPCAVYGPDGKRLEAFGLPTLRNNESKSCTISWPVTAEQLDSGSLTFTLAYTVFDDDGMLGTGKESVSAEIHRKTLRQTPPEISLELSPSELDGPGPVMARITVTNPSRQDMPGPMALYAPDGSMISDFGTPTLAAGAQQILYVRWDVTEEQLAAGCLTFFAVYSLEEADGSIATRLLTISRPVTSAAKTSEVASAAVPELHLTLSMEANRTEFPVFPSPVKFTVTVTNTGTCDAEDIQIKCDQLTLYTISSLPAGKSLTFSRDFSANMAGKYRFDAVARDASGAMVSFPGETITLTQESAVETVPDVVETAMPAEASSADMALSLFLSLAPITLLITLIAVL